MLDPWIIAEIIRREREEERRQERRIELPLQNPRHHDDRPTVQPPPSEDKDRGVTTIDI